MALIQPKQVRKFLVAPVRASLSLVGSSVNATSALTTTLTTAGDAGASVPLGVASTAAVGVLTTSPLNRVEIVVNGDKVVSGANRDEVYGRITESAGVYTLSFFTTPSGGAETAYTFASATTAANTFIDFNYRFDFDRYPAEGAVATTTRNIYQDPRSVSLSKVYTELITIATQNTIPAISKTPDIADNVKLYVNGMLNDSLGGSPAFTVNTSTKTLTWSAANAGFNLDTTDRVVCSYTSLE